jgi:hypothetical protein
MGAKIFAQEIGSESDNICPTCGLELAIKGKKGGEEFREAGFQGGYPFTRALEIVEAALIAIGVKDQKTVVKAWENLLSGNGLEQLHHDIQSPEKYIASIRKYGEKYGLLENASRLTAYMEAKLTEISNAYPLIQNKPRAYYCMGKPLFSLNGERFENQLMELAGGSSVNKEINLKGRPGQKISVSCLNALNPEVIFISAFLSSSSEDFYKDCYKAGVDVEALRSKRVYTHLAPGWDFGSPRWILGLMHAANILHPDIYQFDMTLESQQFYRSFYDSDFILSSINRSFSKPNREWKWLG